MVIGEPDDFTVSSLALGFGKASIVLEYWFIPKELEGKILMLSMYKLFPPPDLRENLNLKFSTQDQFPT